MLHELQLDVTRATSRSGADRNQTAQLDKIFSILRRCHAFEEYVEQAQRMAPGEGHAFVEAVNPVLFTIIHLELDEVDRAQGEATKAIDLAERYGLAEIAQMALAHSVLARTHETPDDAAAAARHGVDLARRSPERVMYTYALACAGDVLCHLGEPDGPGFIAEGRTVVNKCVDPGVAGRYLDRVAARHHLVASQPSTPTLIEALTDRELTVLRYLPSALSQREIANELYVSLNTVKTHCRAIYRKLGAGGRKAAVQTARDLDIL